LSLCRRSARSVGALERRELDSLRFAAQLNRCNRLDENCEKRGGSEGWAQASVADQREGDQSYAVRRFTDEANRLYGVLNNRLYDRRRAAAPPASRLAAKAGPDGVS
jgi:hypothetical protein